MMWGFCLRSLVREYGWRFVGRVAARRPLAALRAIRQAAAIDDRAGCVTAGRLESRPAVVGAGFCLKPLDPPCPSGRFNHECVLLEQSAGRALEAAPPVCRACTIGAVGTRALNAGAAFYVMTSARDILDDIFVPAMRRCAFASGLFVICRYSFRPFAFGLLASGMSGRLLPLGQGDCRDYRTWLLADRGFKQEQTAVGAAAMADVATRLPAEASARAIRVERRGNVLYPGSGKSDG